MESEITSFDLGIWMKSKRKEYRLSQSDLAKKVNVHATSIARWECGDYYPTLDKAEDIAKALGGKIVIKDSENGREED